MEDKTFLKLLKTYKKACKQLYTAKSGAISESSESEGYKTRFNEVLGLFKEIEEEFVHRCKKSAKIPMKEDGQLNIRAVKKMCRL